MIIGGVAVGLGHQTEMESRVLRHVLEVDGCWVWQSSLDQLGYGRVCVARKSRIAHRFSYEVFVGPIPDGLELDHLCRNRSCVNPDHLEPVTHRENMRRSVLAYTHCKNGHAFDEKNTRLEKERGGGVRRRCIACQREASRRYTARKRAKRAAA